jgi:hypothetical protein
MSCACLFATLPKLCDRALKIEERAWNVAARITENGFFGHLIP